MTDEERIKSLEEENLQLKNEKEKLREELKRVRPNLIRKAKKYFRWGRLTIEAYLGKGLKNSINQLLSEITEQKKISQDTIAELSSRLIIRFSRLGFFRIWMGIITLLFTGLQIWFLDNQNKIAEKQNKISQTQIELQEAERRSSFFMTMIGNISSEIDREITEDTLGKLSSQLINRITALSYASLPYRFLAGDNFTDKEYSPERGQLLLTLVNSGINPASLDAIYAKADFSEAYLAGVNLDSAYLKKINLKGANLYETKLNFAILSKADLREANLRESDLYTADLFNAQLYNANMSRTDLRKANLSNSNLKDVNLDSATYVQTLLNGALITRKTKITSPRIQDNYKVEFFHWDDYLKDSIFQLVEIKPDP